MYFENLNQLYLSHNGSPKKHYRWLQTKKHGRLGYDFQPNPVICTRFALLPLKVDGGWIWLESYYALKMVTRAFVLGGSTSIAYSVVQRSKSIFKFKSILKKKGSIRNLTKGFRDNHEMWLKLGYNTKTGEFFE